MKKACLIVGTRPELIKMAPVAFALKQRGIPYMILNTAQHTDLLAPYWDVFGLVPDHTLSVMQTGQSLAQLTARALVQLQEFYTEHRDISCILGQGDTTTVLCASMTAFYQRIPFMHVEAGLRSYDFDNPFPEEYNRRVAAIWCSHHFAPTERAKKSLLSEGVAESSIHVTGNTIVDAMHYILEKESSRNGQFSSQPLQQKVAEGKKMVLITCHRRENHGSKLSCILDAIGHLADRHKEMNFIWLLHPNPNVKDVLMKSELRAKANVLLHEPLDYFDLLKLMRISSVIVTDSGGVQEEAPSFGKPVVVMREVTERPEGIEAGLAVLADADPQKIINGFDWALNWKGEKISNPYGDGKAANRIAEVIATYYNNGK
ncbi:MAG TPA: UDP-N-acetylglucosamine 2-epimerase (non-hydrolyzing) [Chitinophagaceae bacterium]